jgi:hypothetical protein
VAIGVGWRAAGAALRASRGLRRVALPPQPANRAEAPNRVRVDLFMASPSSIAERPPTPPSAPPDAVPEPASAPEMHEPQTIEAADAAEFAGTADARSALPLALAPAHVSEQPEFLRAFAEPGA